MDGLRAKLESVAGFNKLPKKRQLFLEYLYGKAGLNKTYAAELAQYAPSQCVKYGSEITRYPDVKLVMSGIEKLLGLDREILRQEMIDKLRLIAGLDLPDENTENISDLIPSKKTDQISAMKLMADLTGTKAPIEINNPDGNFGAQVLVYVPPNNRESE